MKKRKEVFLKEHSVLTVMDQVIFAALFDIFFAVFLFMAEKKIDHKRFIAVCWGMLLIWAGMVFYLAVFSRAPRVRKVKVELFWSYGKAINGLKRGGFKYFRYCALNILVFVPFGMLVQRICAGGAKALGIAILAGLFVSLAIETIQYAFHLGIFETDDLFSNTVGSALGAAVSAAAGHMRGGRRKANVPQGGKTS